MFVTISKLSALRKVLQRYKIILKIAKEYADVRILVYGV